MVILVESPRSHDQEGTFRPRTRGHPPGNPSRTLAVRQRRWRRRRRRRWRRTLQTAPAQQRGRDVHVRRRDAPALVRRTAIRVRPRGTAHGTRQQQVRWLVSGEGFGAFDAPRSQPPCRFFLRVSTERIFISVSCKNHPLSNPQTCERC